MTSLSLRDHGYTLSLKGLVELEACKQLAFQMRDEWAGVSDPFVWMIDARALSGFSADAQALFEELLEEGLDRGLLRITVLAVTTRLASLFVNIMLRADAMELYQFLDVSYEEEYQELMEEWLNSPFPVSASS